MGVKTTFWGPIAWEVLFLIAALCDDMPLSDNYLSWWQFIDMFALVLPCGYCRLSVHRCLEATRAYIPADRLHWRCSRWAFVLRQQVSQKLICQDIQQQKPVSQQETEYPHTWYQIQTQYLSMSRKDLLEQLRAPLLTFLYTIHADIPTIHQQEMHRIPIFALRVYALRHIYDAIRTLIPDLKPLFRDPLTSALSISDYTHSQDPEQRRPRLFRILHNQELTPPSVSYETRIQECGQASIPPWSSSPNNHQTKRKNK